ncbi:MAG: amidase [Hyphomicrobiales bacterium]
MDQRTYRQLDAAQIVSLVKAGDVSASEVAEAAVAAVTDLNPALNAVVLLDVDGARLQASRVDRQAPLAGVPVLVKDNNLSVDGWPTTYGSKFFEGAAPESDSHFIRRLRAAGAVLIGKTNTPEFASDWTTEPTWRGPTRNPCNTGHSPGGSSGGSAAAVASRMVPVAHGNDNAGSIRVPSAVCGIYGLKPTRGLTPIGPVFPELAAGLDSEHVLTRTVRDSALFLDCVAGPEPGGQYRVVRAGTSYLAALNQPLPPQRIGLVTQHPSGGVVDPEIAAAVEHAAALLERQGHIIEPIAMPYDPGLATTAEALYFTEIALLVRQRANTLRREPRRDELEAITVLALDRVKSIDAVSYLENRHRMHLITAGLTRQVERYDALITPTTAQTAPRLGEFDSRTERFEYARWCDQSARFAPFTDLFNATGQPAASVPVGRASSGLPIGAQIAAAQGRDDLVLQLCHCIETGLLV